MTTPTRAIQRSAASLMLAALAACVDTSPPAVPAPDVCRSISEQYYQAERDVYAMDLATAESRYVQVLSALKSGAGRHCPSAPSEARVTARLANVQSGQLEFLSASELLADARRGEANPTAEDRSVLSGELSTIELVDRMHRSAITGAAPVLTPSDAAPTGVEEGAVHADTGGGLIALSDAQKRRIVADAWDDLAKAAALIRSGEAQAALQRIEQGLRSLQTVPVAAVTMAPRFYLQRSIAQLALGQTQAAVASAEAGVRGVDQVVPNSAVAARARMIHADALVQAGRAGEAVPEYDAAMDLYEQNPVAIQYETAWPLIRFAQAEIAQRPDRAAAWQARIFRVAQLVRSSGTVKAIAGAARSFAAGDGDEAEAVRSWKQADDRLASVKGLLLVARRNPLVLQSQLDALEGELAQADAAERAARDRRDRVAPEYRAALEAPVSLDRVRKTLRHGEVLVQILVGKPRSLMLVVQPAAAGGPAVRVRTIHADSGHVAGIVGGMRSILEAEYLRPGAVAIDQFPADLSHQLYRLLFGDLAGLVEAQERVFLVSNGMLQSYPFETLITKNPGSGKGSWRGAPFDYSHLSWLGDAVEIDYLPAARNLVDLRSVTRASRGQRAALTFGDPEQGMTADGLMRAAGLPQGCRAFAEGVASLPRLYGMRDQAQEVAAILGHGSEAVVGPAFTKSYFARHRADLGDYRILHFATHGLLPSSANCFTEPALTTSFDPSGAGNTLLTTTEIRQFHLDAQLVVLSACDTIGAEGRLAETGGESLSTLTRAFFAAGARTVIASQWQVLADETSVLMRAMYRRIAVDNAGFGAALRGAQAEVRRNPASSHPTYWAAFVLMGDGATTLYPGGGRQSSERRP
ncbi:MAG: CHAT domain-containing protein [Rhodospirillaceae bacterium]|nr:CHAT domain-containing protein [Rhodospirillaceae bacterium]